MKCNAWVRGSDDLALLVRGARATQGIQTTKANKFGHDPKKVMFTKVSVGHSTKVIHIYLLLNV